MTMELPPESEAKVPGQTAAALTLETIPEECQFAILARLSAPQLSQARLACKTLAAVGKRPDLPPRQEQLQLALTALGDNSLLVRGMRQGPKEQKATWGQLLQQPGARETLRHMPALELVITDQYEAAEHCREMFRAVASCLQGSAALRVLRLANLRVLDDGAAALLEEGSAAFLRGLHHLDLEEWDLLDLEGCPPADLRNLEGLRSLRFKALDLIGRLPLAGSGGLQDMACRRGLTFYSCREPEEGAGPGTAQPSPASVLDPASFRSLEFRDYGAPDSLARAIAEAGPMALAGLTSLSFKGRYGRDEDVAAIARAPATRALTSLHLAGSGLTLEAVRALAESSGLRSLKDLKLQQVHIFADGPEAAGEPAALQGLMSLSLKNCTLNSEGVCLLEKYLDLGALQSLSLEACDYYSHRGRYYHRGWVACVRRWAAGAKGLTSLYLPVNQLESTELEELLPDIADLQELSALELTGNSNMRGAMVAHLARLSRLTSLDLTCSRMGDTGAAVLASAGFSALRRLVLDINSITVEGLKALAASPVLKELVDLSLADNWMIGDEGAAVLAVAPSLAKLTQLCLRNCNVGDSGALALSTSSTLQELAILTLEGGERGPKLTIVGANHLALSTSLISLKHVHFRPNG